MSWDAPLRKLQFLVKPLTFQMQSELQRWQNDDREILCVITVCVLLISGSNQTLLIMFS